MLRPHDISFRCLAVAELRPFRPLRGSPPGREQRNNGFEWEEWMDGIHRGLKLNIS